jgi:hypothetical protein
MAFRDFDSARAATNADPIRFKLGGYTFTCLAQAPIGAALDLARAPEPDPLDPNADVTVLACNAIDTFVQRLLASPRDVKRWQKVLRDRKNPVSSEDLVELAFWLAEEYTARPTQPSADSSAGRRPTSRTSTGSRFTPDTGRSGA